MIRFLLLLSLAIWAGPAFALDAAAYTHVDNNGIPTLYFFAPACDAPATSEEPPDIAECIYLEMSCGSDGETAMILRDVSSRDISRWFAEPDGPSSVLTIGGTRLAIALRRVGVNFLSGGWDILFAAPYRAFSSIPGADLAAESWDLQKLDATLTFPVSGANRAVEAFVTACSKPHGT